MNQTTKITLSIDEQQLVCNTQWILTKHTITEKVFALFGNVLNEMQHTIDAEKINLPIALLTTTPKIYKGENYKQLPYVLLDYPRCFEKENTLAIRCLFWWGNFFSIQLLVSGKYMAVVRETLQMNYVALKDESYFICINEDPWQHHFDADNFIEIRTLTQEAFTEILQRMKFLKIARKIPLNDWDKVPHFLENNFVRLIGFLK